MARRRAGDLRGGARRTELPRPHRPRLRPPRRGRVGRAARVGGRAGRGRARDGPVHVRVRARALGPRARDGAVPGVPRAADAGARELGPPGAEVRDLPERAAPGALPPVDELPDRAAVRACERGHLDRRRLPRARLPLADHARDPVRLRPRQARRDLRHLVARCAREPRAYPAAGRLGGRRRRRDDRRHRLYRRSARRDARLPRQPARGGEARDPQRGALRGRPHLAPLPHDGDAPEAAEDPRAARGRGAAHGPLRRRRSRARPHPGTARRAGHRRRVRRLRVPLLRPGGARRPRAPARFRRRPLRLAPPAAERRPPEHAARGRGRRGRREPGRVLGDARPPARPPGRPRPEGPRPPGRTARARRRPVLDRPA